jgi:hypothetical protein
MPGWNFSHRDCACNPILSFIPGIAVVIVLFIRYIGVCLKKMI